MKKIHYYSKLFTSLLSFDEALDVGVRGREVVVDVPGEDRGLLAGHPGAKLLNQNGYYVGANFEIIHQNFIKITETVKFSPLCSSVLWTARSRLYQSIEVYQFLCLKFSEFHRNPRIQEIISQINRISLKIITIVYRY